MDALHPRPANSSPLTPISFLERSATVYGNCPSVVYKDTTYTWTETYVRSLCVASSIASMGIEKGHVVSVMAPNIPAMYELQFAVPMAGMILNNINTRLDARTVSVLLLHCESKLVFVDHEYSSLLLQSLTLFPTSSPRPMLILITDKNNPQGEDDYEHSLKSTGHFLTDYETLATTGDPQFNWVRPKTEWDPFVLNYTSGTTSSPKGVVHSHRGLFLTTVGCLIDWFVPKQPVFLWTLPMFHANGWSFPWGIAAVGGTNVCMRRFDAGMIYEAVCRYGVTHMCAAPVVLNMLSNYANGKKLEKPVEILTAGAPPSAEVLRRTETIGFRVTHGYGMTETGHVVSCAWKREWDRYPAAERARLKARQGVATLAMAEIDVVDRETGERVKRDGSGIGEVVLRGGSVMLGYLKDSEATGKAMREDGWFYTGDVGVMHPDGYLEIKDRSKDIIITGGENVSSVEVESVLYSHPAVNEAAVVARPDEFWGETPCAFLSLKPKIDCKPTEKEVIEFCKAKMPHYMAPKTVVFKDELPKTSTGKIQKFILRDIAKSMAPVKSRM